MTSELPLMYLVVECITMSMSHSKDADGDGVGAAGDGSQLGEVGDPEQRVRRRLDPEEAGGRAAAPKAAVDDTAPNLKIVIVMREPFR
jgi:hypothetical protein